MCQRECFCECTPPHAFSVFLSLQLARLNQYSASDLKLMPPGVHRVRSNTAEGYMT